MAVTAPLWPLRVAVRVSWRLEEEESILVRVRIGRVPLV